MILVILVTGSREWTDSAAIRGELLREYEKVAGYVELDQVTVRHGAQGMRKGKVAVKGTDALADQEALSLGMRTDPQPADWYGPCRAECKPSHRRRDRYGGSYCPAAGNYRNQDRLVDREPRPDCCLAFPLPESRGTWDCIRRAEAAGIPTYVYGEQETHG